MWSLFPYLLYLLCFCNLESLLLAINISPVLTIYCHNPSTVQYVLRRLDNRFDPTGNLQPRIQTILGSPLPFHSDVLKDKSMDKLSEWRFWKFIRYQSFSSKTNFFRCRFLGTPPLWPYCSSILTNCTAIWFEKHIFALLRLGMTKAVVRFYIFQFLVFGA